MRLGRPVLLAAFAVTAAFAACTLNPQPLPPSDNERANAVGDDAGSFGGSDSGAVTTIPEIPPPQAPADASVGANDGDAGPDGTTDGGDGGITDADTDGG